MAKAEEWAEAPERAITVFEEIHSLRVTLHDLQGTLWPFLRSDRFFHTHPLCQAFKMQTGNVPCVNFENHDLRAALAGYPDGRTHICPAGFVEWVVPVFREGALRWVLFAGPRAPGRNYVPDFRSIRLRLPVAAEPESLPTVEEDESLRILEHLRQLAARLESWSVLSELPLSPAGEKLGYEVATRRLRILRFVHDNHTRPVGLSDLARTLGLSESRTGHAIRECCDATFPQLIAEARLRTAMGLLRHSALSIVEVAVSSGFTEPSRFHRLFRAATGLTPNRYRQSARA